MEVNNWGTVSDCTFERRNELAMKMVEFEVRELTWQRDKGNESTK